MGINVIKDLDNNSKLNQRISADLRNRIQTAKDNDAAKNQDLPLEEFKKTSRFSWIWFIMAILAAASLIFIIL